MRGSDTAEPKSSSSATSQPPASSAAIRRRSAVLRSASHARSSRTCTRSNSRSGRSSSSTSWTRTSRFGCESPSSTVVSTIGGQRRRRRGRRGRPATGRSSRLRPPPPGSASRARRRAPRARRSSPRRRAPPGSAAARAARPGVVLYACDPVPLLTDYPRVDRTFLSESVFYRFFDGLLEHRQRSSYIVDDVDASHRVLTADLLGFEVVMTRRRPSRSSRHGALAAAAQRVPASGAGAVRCSRTASRPEPGGSHGSRRGRRRTAARSKVRRPACVLRSELVEGVGGDQVLVMDPAGNLRRLPDPADYDPGRDRPEGPVHRRHRRDQLRLLERAVERGIELYVLNRGRTSLRPLPAEARVLAGRRPRPGVAPAPPSAIASSTPSSTWWRSRRSTCRPTSTCSPAAPASTSSSARRRPTRRPPARLPVVESTPLRNPFWQYSRDKIACEDLLVARLPRRRASRRRSCGRRTPTTARSCRSTAAGR